MYGEGLATSQVETRDHPIPRVAEIQSVICAEYGLTLEEMKSETRTYRLAWPRQIACALSREMTLNSYPQIARMFGNRDHTTVLYAVRKVDGQKQRDPQLAVKIDGYKAKIRKIAADRIKAMEPPATLSADVAEANESLRAAERSKYAARGKAPNRNAFDISGSIA